MFVDPIAVQYPEALEKERFVIATYYCATPRDTNSLKFAVALGIEQSCGTWVKVPGETPEVRERSIARVVGIYETPSYSCGMPADVDKRHFIIRIAFPAANFGPSFAMLLSTVIGNISSSGEVKLLDLEFPDSYLKEFKGPKFGIGGLRDLLGVHDRPLLNNMIKPCTGLDPKMTAKLAYEAAVGGVDIIKDDELVANPPHCPLEERVKAVMPAIKQADKEKGEKTLYAFNITDRTENLKKNAITVMENGGNCLLLNYNSVGLDACRMIAEDSDIDIPILAHSDYTGAVYESPWSGVSLNLIGAVFPRMAGMDMVIALSPYGKFPMMEDAFINAGYKMIQPLGHIKPIMPMPGGGTTQGHIQDLIEKFGTDVMIAAGGAIHGHPMGAIAGAKAFRQGIDAVMSGKTLRQASEEYAELKAAVDAWGIYGEDQGKIFDLKG